MKFKKRKRRKLHGVIILPGITAGDKFFFLSPMFFHLSLPLLVHSYFLLCRKSQFQLQVLLPIRNFHLLWKREVMFRPSLPPPFKSEEKAKEQKWIHGRMMKISWDALVGRDDAKIAIKVPVNTRSDF